MENRARYVLCFMALIILLPILSIKGPFADPTFVLVGIVVGFFMMWNFGCNVARRPKFREMLLLYQGADVIRDGIPSALFSPTYNFGYWLVGACAGGFIGFNVSVLINAYYSLPFEIAFSLCLNCAVSCLAWIAVQSFENLVNLREICIEAYIKTEPYWTPRILLRSQIVTFTVAEFIGLLACLYLAFFQLVWTGLYKLAFGNFHAFVMLVLAFCALQVISCIAREYNKRHRHAPVSLEETTTIEV
mmetsp:Transcript_1795/g.3892  ORF Transcript_1795/g.3892 Transcript_1795/m.3892 type:complete len:246 (-) Transcript_1795:4590-5327(-)